MVEIKGKKIIVLGLAKSGTAIAKILYMLGAEVIVNDAKEKEKCQGVEELENLGIKVICGGHPDGLIDNSVDLIVKNPGIPYTIAPIIEAEKLNIPIITEIELAYQFAKTPIIAVTGSNGKTTTTTLIGEIMNTANKSPIVAGNIGTVLSEKAYEANENQVLIAELSSFQLKGTIDFKPDIAILVNIYPAHLDYHQTIEDYINSKAKIFKNQTKDDYAIINSNCDESRKLLPLISSQIYYFSTKGSVSRGAFIEDDKIFWQENNERTELVELKNVFLKGAHLENVLAAIVASKLYGVEFEVIIDVIKNFKGVEHRVEYVKETATKVIYYNDSKATNPQATISAITSFDKPIILIAGGLDRGIDFYELLEPFKNNVKTIITYGQTSEKLNKIAKLAGLQQIYTVDNVSDAVEKSYTVATAGDIVLLSPACASWDMFTSFEERGRIFKEAVHKLI